MYRDRHDAGVRLAELLGELALIDPLVLAIPRGGAEVAAPIAHALGASLDVLLAVKLRAPNQPELAIGAIAEGDPPVELVNRGMLSELRIDEEELEAERADRAWLLSRRARRYRSSHLPPDLHGRTVVLVDDGAATGTTTIAAVRAAMRAGAVRTVLALPVAPTGTASVLRREADELVCPLVSARIHAVGQAYADFSPVPEERVLELLAVGASG